MNVKRGLMRLWIVASVIWVGFWVSIDNPWKHVALVYDLGHAQEELRALQPIRPGQAPDVSRMLDQLAAARKGSDEATERNLRVALEVERRIEVAWYQLRLFAIIALLPPVGALVLSFAGLWIVRGFRA